MEASAQKRTSAEPSHDGTAFCAMATPVATRQATSAARALARKTCSPDEVMPAPPGRDPARRDGPGCRGGVLVLLHPRSHAARRRRLLRAPFVSDGAAL